MPKLPIHATSANPAQSCSQMHILIGNGAMDCQCGSALTNNAFLGIKKKDCQAMK